MPKRKQAAVKPTMRARRRCSGMDKGEEKHPTWLEHTLEIKDDQNKGSQTGGEYHPAYPAHPHQVTQSLFHDWEAAARFGGTRRAAGLSGSLEVPGRSVAGQGARRIHSGAYHCEDIWGGGWAEPGPPTPYLEKMNAPRCALVSRSIRKEEQVRKHYW